jgi:hypothetical protein
MFYILRAELAGILFLTLSVSKYITSVLEIIWYGISTLPGETDENREVFKEILYRNRTKWNATFSGNERYLGFEGFTAWTMKNDVFWDVAPCEYCENRRFGRMCRLHLHGRRIRERRKTLSVVWQSVLTRLTRPQIPEEQNYWGCKVRYSLSW